jgi:hypothetical protein
MIILTNIYFALFGMFTCRNEGKRKKPKPSAASFFSLFLFLCFFFVFFSFFSRLEWRMVAEPGVPSGADASVGAGEAGVGAEGVEGEDAGAGASHMVTVEETAAAAPGAGRQRRP